MWKDGCVASKRETYSKSGRAVANTVSHSSEVGPAAVVTLGGAGARFTQQPSCERAGGCRATLCEGTQSCHEPRSKEAEMQTQTVCSQHA